MKSLTITITVAAPEGMAIPDYERLIKLKLKELTDKFYYYENSWLGKNHEYWVKRFSDEVKEYESAEPGVAKMRKAVNLSNLADLAAAVEVAKMVGGNEGVKVV